tara:strand:+ start:359 stop:496 length:138 start_codon:yes stop_codon:yes gene_type:complete
MNIKKNEIIEKYDHGLVVFIISIESFIKRGSGKFVAEFLIQVKLS